MSILGAANGACGEKGGSSTGDRLSDLCRNVGLRRPYVRDAVIGEAEMKAELTPPASLTPGPEENQAEAGT